MIGSGQNVPFGRLLNFIVKYVPVLILTALLAACGQPESQHSEPVKKKPVSNRIDDAYLHINAQKPGVNVMASGLQFEILESGVGRSPTPDSIVRVHYHGTLVSGDVFDSSVDRGEPLTFGINQVIEGWKQALPMMKEGDRWRLVIPSDLGYGPAGAAGGKIPPDATLIFEVELIEVVSDG